MTPEERERLKQQLTIITAPLPPQPRQRQTALAEPETASAPGHAEGGPAQTPETVVEAAPPKPGAAHGKRTLHRLRRWRLVLFAAMVGLALLGTGLVEGLSPQVLTFSSQLLGLVPALPTATPVPTQIPENVIARPPTITIAEIDLILERVNSPILPYSGDVYAYGVQYGIDPVFALAFWMKESREASDGSIAAVYHNPGYTEGLAGDPRCGRWACWPTWPEGIAGWYHYMRVFFVNRGITTVEAILPIYAPSSENNTSGYIVFVLQHVAQWRAESAANA